MPSLRCCGLRKAFGGVQALTGVDLTFPQAGIVGIVGPNGAGKTTLVHLLTGFLRADGGSCFVGDAETTRLTAHRVAQLGVARTFQEMRLVERLSALENVLLGCPAPRGECLWRSLFGLGISSEAAKNRALALDRLSFVGLGGMADEPAGELSYGQQKLLGLACALVRSPRVLVLDEPVAGLQPSTAEQMLGLLRSLRVAGHLVVFIEHDLSAVRQVAEQVVVMDHGRVIAQGKPGEVLDRQEIMEAYVS